MNLHDSLTRRMRLSGSAPVAIARCRSIEHLVRGKTVTVKLNLTGQPGETLPGYLPGITHWTHPVVVAACCHALGKAGARRIRQVESIASPDSLEECMAKSGWDVKALLATARGIETEKTCNLGPGPALRADEAAPTVVTFTPPSI